MQENRTKQNDMKTGLCSDADDFRSALDKTVVFSSTTKPITVSKPVLKEENGMVVLSADVSGAVSGTCFFSTELANRDYVDETSSNCFLIGLLFTAMYAGCDLIIEGTVSEKLLFHTRNYIIPMLVGFFEGQLHPVKIFASQVSSKCYLTATAVGTGFSGGIDSFHTIRQFFLDYDGPAADKVNTLLFFNAGSHGMGRDKKRLEWLEKKFQERRNVLSGYSKDIGLPFIVVDSNIFAFMQKGHLQNSSLTSCAAALFLGAKLRLYYFGSAGFLYHDLFYPGRFMDRDYDIEKIDDFILPHICTESFAASSDGSSYSRTQKTMMICSDPLVQKYLNVCNNPQTVAKNCSVCYKCQRTLLTLDILGVTNQFANVFDLAKYTARERSRYIATVLNNRKRDPFLQDICDFAKSRNYDLKSKTSVLTRTYMRFTETGLYRFLRSFLRKDHR